MIKFPGILQAAFFLLGHTKMEINQNKTANLDWKKVQSMITPELYERITEYNHRGPKHEEPLAYGKIGHLQKKLEK